MRAPLAGGPMVNKPMIVVAAVVVAAAAGVVYYFHSRTPHLPQIPAAAPASAAAPTEPATLYPVPAPASETKTPLPSLADSDAAIKDALGSSVGGDAVSQFFIPDDVIRHIVVTIDNLPRQKVAVAKRPTEPVTGNFMADGDELHATLDPQNYARYEPMMKVVRNLDMPKVAATYLHFYPLFQSVYQDLGYPNGYFNDRLVQVIDSLLATPTPQGPIELTRPNVMYLYADPALEARPAGQKLLLRMGPDNATVIKAKLTELRALITAAPPIRRKVDE
jgi:hypothetical protein